MTLVVNLIGPQEVPPVADGVEAWVATRYRARNGTASQAWNATLAASAEDHLRNVGLIATGSTRDETTKAERLPPPRLAGGVSADYEAVMSQDPCMVKTKLSDAEGKDILRKWPRVGRKLWSTPADRGAWVRAQPGETGSSISGPRLKSPGAERFKTQPDGLWIHLHGIEYCDAIAVEVCGTVQNLNDKRARYMPTTGSLLVEVDLPWANDPVRTRGRGGPARPLWKAAGLDSAEQSQLPAAIPVRHLRVLYALPDAKYREWIPSHTATGYEYFVPHSSLGSYNSQQMQRFLRQLSVTAHVYKDPVTWRVNS